MAEKTGIAWTSRTINPWRGCTKISPGCLRCYAEQQEGRFNRAKWGKHAVRELSVTAEAKVKSWDRQLKREGKTDTVFCASLSDFFEDNSQVLSWREHWWDIIREANSLDWLILTKRSGFISMMLPVDFFSGKYSHVHLGVSVESADYVNRLDHLRAIPDWGGLRWTSMEPLIGPVGPVNLEKVDWVIVGGESSNGNDFRPMKDEWVDEIKSQCEKHGSVFFYKQSGGRNGTITELFRGELIQNFPKFR